MRNNPIERAYLAGFIDGEGCISITGSRQAYGKTMKMAPTISVANTNFDVLEWAKSKTQLGIIRPRPKPNSPKKDSFELDFRVDEIIPLLDLVDEFLIVKKRQAELMRQFFRVKGGQSNTAPTLEVYTERLRVMYEIQSLNKKGK